MAHIRLSILLTYQMEIIYIRFSSFVAHVAVAPSYHVWHSYREVIERKSLRNNNKRGIQPTNRKCVLVLKCTLVLAPATENQQFGAAHTLGP